MSGKDTPNQITPIPSYVHGKKQGFKSLKIKNKLSLASIYTCAQSCSTLCKPMDSSSPPGSSVHGIFQVRILEWVAIFSPGDLPDRGIKPHHLHRLADSLLLEPPGKPTYTWPNTFSLSCCLNLFPSVFSTPVNKINF